MASRERTGSGMKGRGTGWDELREKDMYTTREEIREKKKWEKGRKVCIFYMLTFSSFFCASLQTQKGMVLLCISLCIHKKEKNVYVKLHTANKADVMRAYVYVCILKKCSGWFRCADFRKFCAGLFAYFFCWQQEKYVCLYVQKRKQNVYVYIHKKKEQNAYVYVCKI